MEASQIIERILDQKVDLLALWAAEKTLKGSQERIDALRALANDLGHLALFRDIIHRLTPQQSSKPKRRCIDSKILEYFIDYSLRKISKEIKQDIHQVLGDLGIEKCDIIETFMHVTFGTMPPSASDPDQS